MSNELRAAFAEHTKEAREAEQAARDAKNPAAKSETDTEPEAEKVKAPRKNRKS